MNQDHESKKIYHNTSPLVRKLLMKYYLYYNHY